MEQPVYVYYELNRFYQNHRKYVKSWDYAQLSEGEEKSKADVLDTCDGAITNGDLNKTLSAGESPVALDPSAVAFPCGLIAKSYFTDNFYLWKDGALIFVNRTNIA